MSSTPHKKSLDKPVGTKGHGLLPTTKDERDFSLGAVYGQLDLKKIPQGNFNLPQPLTIKDQTVFDFCPTFMATEISEDQERIPLGAFWQFAMMKELTGEWESWGGDLRTALLSLVKVGSIPATVEADFLARQGHLASDRNFLANWNNWPIEFKKTAEEYKKSSLFAVKGSYDAFDNVRAALWQHREEKCSIGLGVMWRYNWNDCPGGVIPLEADGAGEGHALKAFDVVVINKVQHIAIQNSWGKDVGNGGIFYANREVFNAYFGNYGFFMVKDMPVQVAKYLIDNNLTAKSAWWVAIWVAIKDLFTRHAQPKIANA